MEKKEALNFQQKIYVCVERLNIEIDDYEFLILITNRKTVME